MIEAELAEALAEYKKATKNTGILTLNMRSQKAKTPHSCRLKKNKKNFIQSIGMHTKHGKN